MPNPSSGPRFRTGFLIAAAACVLTGADCAGPGEPKHQSVEGAVAGGYFQRLFNGKQANELPGTNEIPVVQYYGTLCLFEGGNYSYGRRFWLYNSRANGGVDADVVYGTYQGSPTTAPLSFAGTVSGGATVKGDTINVGANQFIRFAQTTADCDTQR
jgi:hypothetical protein